MWTKPCPLRPWYQRWIRNGSMILVGNPNVQTFRIILVTFLERPPEAKHRPIQLLISSTSSETHRHVYGIRAGARINKSVISPSIEWLPPADKTLAQHGSTCSLGTAFLRLLSDNSKGRCYFCRPDWPHIPPHPAAEILVNRSRTTSLTFSRSNWS